MVQNLSILLLVLHFLTKAKSLGCVHNKVNHTKLLCSFQKGKDLKLEIEMTSNHCTKFMV
jgi:hypothetical protein